MRLYELFKEALDEESLASSTGGNDVQLPGHSVAMHIMEQPEMDNRHYNSPSSVVILPDQGSGIRDIRVLLRGGAIQSISELHPNCYSPLAYVRLFPTSSPGSWHPGIIIQTGPNATTPPPSTKLTCLMHAAFRLFVRPAPLFSNHLHLAGKLFHQYIVDCYAQREQGHRNFVRHNQPKLRAELHQGIADAVAGEDVTNTRQLGHRIILPVSHIGSARNMHDQIPYRV
jgi:Helitron helicase-like domain at N-terminus